MTFTLNVDLENKEAKKLIEFLKSLSYLQIKETKSEDFEVPDWHKKIVSDRSKTARKENFKTWDEVKKSLKRK